ncbi:Beta-TrCP [Dactylella cylindrospora]|nr:Beta-TrCP [Dactylella cylindrospora]
MDIEASSKVAVVPFLSKHIPEQYASQHPPRVNTKYCYRHHPDLKCRRQADEPTMEEVQKGLEKLPVSDQQAISHVWTIFSAAPASQRNLILQGILTQCCFPQLSFISASLRDLIRIDFLSALPPELAFRILSFLDTASLCKAAQVSRRWRTLADDDVVWHKMCEQHIDRKCTKCGWGLPLLERKRLRQTKRQMELRAKGHGLMMREGYAGAEEVFERKRASDEEEDPEWARRTKKVCRRASGSIVDEAGTSELRERRQRLWKDVYSERYKVESNWRRGRYQSKIFKGHDNGIVCIQYDDNIVATGSYDTTVKIWDMETANEIRTLRGHTNCVRALQFDETKLISGSMDNTLKVWNWRTGTCINTLRGHQAGVVCLHFEGELLASGSVDHTIRLWNFNDKKTAILRGHTDWVNAVKIHSASNTLFSASDDTTVKMWDLAKRVCIRTFTGHVGHVQQCLPLTLESFDEDECMEDSRDDNSDASSSPGEMSVDPIVRTAAPTHMLSAALDTTVKLWDVATGRCIRTLFGHTQGIWSLGADSLRAITGAEDGMLKIWDIRTGKCERTVTQHVGPVTCVALSDSRMMSGGQDGEAILYCFKPKT